MPNLRSYFLNSVSVKTRSPAGAIRTFLPPTHPPMILHFQALSMDTWPAFESLFGERGACGGCWCMTPRLRSGDYEKQKGEGNRKAMQALVRQGAPAGILAFSNKNPVGWCALAPREHYRRIENSRVLQRVDDRPVWSVSCLFIEKSWRRKGVSVQLLKAAAAYAKEQGAECLEGYPVIPKKGLMPDVFAYTGIVSSFAAAGFKEVARRSETRPIMRLEL